MSASTPPASVTSGRKRQEGRTIPMTVLILGMCRTGTQSIADALAILAIVPVYHMREVYKEKRQAQWIAALEAKFDGIGQPFGREEFDSFIGHYAAVADIPAAIFPAELIAAYPTAKIILTTRSEDSWYDSMMRTLWNGHQAAKTTPKPDGDPMKVLREKYRQVLWADDFPTERRTTYRAHIKLVRRVAPKEPLLEFVVGEGWGPLCGFLGTDVPEVEYSNSDAARS